MIYLIINDGKPDSLLVPMSSVTVIGHADEDAECDVVAIETASGRIEVTKEETLSVITTDDSERYVAQKIFENFIKKPV